MRATTSKTSRKKPKPATKKQKQLLHIRIPDDDERAFMVQRITGSLMKTSCNDLSFNQAAELLERLGLSSHKKNNQNQWGRFSKNNRQHMYILSLMRQIGWTKNSERYGVIADMERLGNWLKSSRSPVQMPLMDMNSHQTNTIINALESMLGKKFDKK